MSDDDDVTRGPANGTPMPRPAPLVEPSNWLKGLIWGLASGWVLIFLPYAVVMAFHYKGLAFLFSASPEWVYNGSVLLLMPIVQGLFGGLMRSPGRKSGTSGVSLISAIWAIDTVMAIAFLHEGVICLIMAAPLIWVMHGVGYICGRWMTALRKPKTLSMSFVPLILLVTIGETTGPVPNHAAIISDSVTVNAPASYVWKYVVDYPDNPNPPDYWMWRIGLPAPTHSVAPVQKVGAHRECQFTGGQRYEERITELEPNKKLTFAVTRQMQHPEILGHVTFDQGQIMLKQNPDGTTTLTTTGWYRLHVRPASYFDWWAGDLTRHIHARTLGYMKSLAERDYRANNGK